MIWRPLRIKGKLPADTNYSIPKARNGLWRTLIVAYIARIVLSGLDITMPRQSAGSRIKPRKSLVDTYVDL